MLWATNTRINESTPWHAHEVFELILCRSNAGRLQLEQREIAFERGRGIVLAPNEQHRYVLQPEEAADVKVACLTPHDVATFLSPVTAAGLQAIRTAGAAHADAAGAPFDVLAASALIPEGYGSQTPRQLRLAWSAIALLLTWICQVADEELDDTAHRSRARFEQVRAWIDSHLDEDLGLDSLASRFGISTSLLSREFRRHAGQSVVEYYNFRRVEQSAQRLAAGRGTVAEIARSSGFSNLSHFHRQFKAFYGLTPAAFRRMVASADAR